MRGPVPSDFNIVDMIINTYKIGRILPEEKKKVLNNILNFDMYKCINDVKLLMRYKLNLNILTSIFNNYASSIRNDGDLSLRFDFDYHSTLPMNPGNTPLQNYQCFKYCNSLLNQNSIEFLLTEDVACTSKMYIEYYAKNFDLCSNDLSIYYLNNFKITIPMVNTPGTSLTYYIEYFRNKRGVLDLADINIPIDYVLKDFFDVNEDIEVITNQFLLHASIKDTIEKAELFVEKLEYIRYKFITSVDKYI